MVLPRDAEVVYGYQANIAVILVAVRTAENDLYNYPINLEMTI